VAATGVDERAFAALLRRLRLRAGLSQEALAEQAGLSPAAIGALEQGLRRRPRPHTVGALAAALRLAPTERDALLAAAEREAPPVAPPVTPPATSPSLPQAPTALIGRDEEVRTAVDMLRHETPPVRLLTLVGPGGVGKTRLALAVAREMQATFADGVVFVDLAALHDHDLVLPTVAWTLGLHEHGGQTARELLVRHLRERHVLLVLDNFEHLLGAAPQLARLLERCPRPALLVTSRAALRLRAERRLPVAPLATPGDQAQPLAAIAAAPAVRLFVDRARAVAPEFRLDPSNAPAVAGVCRRLDGLPLALELAAARVCLLSPEALLRRLERRLPLLAGGAADLPARQRTLRRALAWSHDLLGPAEQVLFRRLAVFAGGWTLEAAEAVCAGADLAPDEVLGWLGALADASLVHRLAGADHAPRFGMLETVREYAEERLEESGEADAIRARHHDWCLALAERVPPEALDPRHVADLQHEQDNLRAALRWAIASGQAQAGLRLAVALFPLWYVRGSYAEGRAWLADVLALGADRPSARRARALSWDGHLAYAQGDFATAEARLGESLAIARAIDDRLEGCLAIYILGHVARDRGDLARARARYEQALRIAVALGNRLLEGFAHEGLASVAERQGDVAGAAAEAAQALRLHREFGHTWDAAHTLDRRVAAGQGDPVAVRQLLERSLVLQRALEHRQGLGESLLALARRAYAEGDVARASRSYAEGLRLAQELGDRVLLLRNLEGVAAVLALIGPEAAARAAGAAAALREQLGADFFPDERERLERGLAPARERLGADRFGVTWHQGRALPLGRVVEEARQLAGYVTPIS
jgi:predicted ATPase/transcriptional regulator with XRE-family HTH domain